MNKKSKIILSVVSSIVVLAIIILGVIGAGLLSVLIEVFSLFLILIGLGYRYGNRNIKIILSSVLIIAILAIINMNMANPLKNRLDDVTWGYHYFVIWVLPLVFLSMILVVKYCKKVLRIVLSSIIVLATLYSIILSVDMGRVASYQKPIFVWETNNKNEISPNVAFYKEFGIDYRASNTVTYQGLGYKVILEDYEYEDEYGSLYTGESETMYILGKRALNSPFVESINVNIIPKTNNESESTMQSHTYQVYANLHDNMPEYRFMASGEGNFVTGLNIYDEKEKAILSVTFDSESRPVYPEMMDTMGLHVTDVNFDGYKDVIILNCFAGAHGNSWYDCWLWDIKTSTFIQSKSFTEICNPALDLVNKCIYSTGGSGASVRAYSIYKFINGVFVVSNDLEFEWKYDGNGSSLGLYVKEETLVDGKLKTVNDTILPGDTAIEKVSYYNDTLWDLSNPRWYGIGGHISDEWLQ